MAFILDDSFEWFLEQFGEPQHIVPPSESVIEKYRGHLPDRLLEYWQEYGFCGFKDGLIWIVNPEGYKATMDSWLKGTEVEKLDKFHVFARSGFGELYLWGEKTGHSWKIQPVKGTLFNEGSDEKDIAAGKANDSLQGFFAIIDPETVDVDDVDTDEPIFEKAVAELGALEPDEMFTFEPALFLGGEQTLKTVKKVNLFIQCEILAEMGHRELMDMKGLVKKAFGN